MKEVNKNELTRLLEAEKLIDPFDISRSIKALLNYYDISQNSICESLEVNKTDLCLMVNGNRKFSRINLLKVCNFLELPQYVSIYLFKIAGFTLRSSNEKEHAIKNILGNRIYFRYDNLLEIISILNLK